MLTGKRQVLIVAAVGLIFAGWSGSLRADFILNGGFETPVITPGAAVDVVGGSTAITSWTVLGNDVFLLSNTYAEPSFGITQFNSHSGLNAIDITGNGNTGAADGIQQVVTGLTPSTAYTLSFWVGRAQSNNGTSFYQDPATVGLSINGGSTMNFTNSFTTSGVVTWEQFSVTFTATSPSTTITFLNDTPSNTNYAGLDDVSLVAAPLSVPEPSSLALCGISGIMALIGLRVRRKRA